MRVLFVIDSLTPGGTEQSTVQLAPYLRDLGIDLTIVTLKSAKHDLRDEARAAGIEVIGLRASRRGSQLRELRNLIRSREPDIVHTALFEADQLGRLAAWRSGIPVVSSFVNTPYEAVRLADPNVRRWKLLLVRSIDAFTARYFVDRFHAVSEGVKLANARALRLPSDRIEVAERGRHASLAGSCTAERRARARASLELDADSPVLLNLGRLEHQKGQADLVEATIALADRNLGCVVLIAGKEGSASESVRRALDGDHEAQAHVRLLGHRSDVVDLLCAADVLVISSRFEGTAGVALEAMAVGVPIVSTDVVGLRGILEHERNAVLVPVGNPRALAAGIERLLDDPALRARLVCAGKQDFGSRFTLDVAAQKLAAFYEGVIARSR